MATLTVTTTIPQIGLTTPTTLPAGMAVEGTGVNAGELVIYVTVEVPGSTNKLGSTVIASGPDGSMAATSSAAIAETNSAAITSSSIVSTTSSQFTSVAPKFVVSTTNANGNVASATITPGPSSDHSDSTPFSSGALAGGIVGGIVGGALLAILAACLFFRRKPKSPRGGAYIEEKPHVYPWDAYLPQSADDGTIRRQVESLYSQIDMHVENYYSNRTATGAPSAELLTKVNSPHLPEPLASLLASTSTPTPVIKHCFAWVILTQLSPEKEGEPSLLPPEFAHMPPQLAAGQKKGGARENQSTPQAYQYWRVLTAHLMYPRAGKRSTNLNDIPAARDCVETLSTAFAPWSKSGSTGREHLISVVKSATETGLVLMSQPSSFAFAWYNDTTKGCANVPTFPSLEKTTDERGTELQQRQTLIKAKTEAFSR